MGHNSPAILAACAMLMSCAVGTTTPTLPAALATQRQTNTPQPTATATALPVSKFIPVDPVNQVRTMRRGINFGNALEAPSEGEWGITIQDTDISNIAKTGFSTIRVPVRWSAHASVAPPYVIEPAFFQRIGHVARAGLDNGLVVVVNMQHYEELFADYQTHRARFVELWRQIADYFKDYPSGLVFELLNEPHDSVSAGVWNALVAETLAVVRTTNPMRNIVIGGVEYNSIHALTMLKLPTDPNLIATFHYYSPMNFTHQGAEWMPGSDKWLGTDWEGNTHDKNSVDFDLDLVKQWSIENNRAVWMGEFGAYNKAELSARARWTTYVAREAERRGFAWSYWEYASGFGAFNRGTNSWVELLRQALVPN